MKLIAHRGASGAHKENTLMAFEAAVAAGVDGIETDVQLSKDGIPVLYHDAHFRRRPIREWLARDLQAVHIDTLDDALIQFGKKTTWLLEFKPTDNPPDVNRALVAATMRRVIQHDCFNHVTLLCFELDLLQLAFKWYPIRCALNLSESTPYKPEWDFLSALSTNIKKTSAAHRETWKDKATYTWTCNSENLIQKASQLGIDAFMTDWPEKPEFRAYRK